MRGTRLLLTTLAAGLLGMGGNVRAQSVESGRAGPRAGMDRDTEVALALSAAPAEVTRDASVIVWTGSRFESAQAGNSGVTCYVARSWPDSREPHCFDAEGSQTILPIHMRQMEMWHDGKTSAEIDDDIGDGLRTGRFRLPSRPVMSYMMSAEQELISDDGVPVGRWEPHLMIYFPYLDESDLGLGTVPSTDAAVVVDPGTPFSNITIVVNDFVPLSSGVPDTGPTRE